MKPFLRIFQLQGWIGLFAVLMFCPQALRSQSANGMEIISNSTVTCEKSEKGDAHNFSLNTVIPADCEKVCIGSEVEYTVANSTSAYFIWTVSGGTITPVSEGKCRVTWDGSALGQLTVCEAAMLNGQKVRSGTIKELCVEKVPSPVLEIKQGLNIISFSSINACVDEEIQLQGIETSGTAEVVYWDWDFGDGTSSSGQNPVHQWTREGHYRVILTGKTACNCITTVAFEINIKSEEYFTIECPSVVCEGDVKTYSTNAQCGSYNWTAQGGTILNQHGNEVEVRWDQVGDDGFGYLIMDNLPCGNLNCNPFTTVEIPVIKAWGKIAGRANVCVGEEIRYSLPKWPATVFHWSIDKSPGGDAFSHVLDMGIDNEREIPVIFTSAGKIILHVEYTNTLTGCKGRADLLITIEEKPVVTGKEKVCQNRTEMYTFTHNGSMRNTDWEIGRPNGNTDYVYNQSQLSCTFSEAGIYFIQAAGQATCPPDVFKVIVSAAPQSPVIYGDPIVCLNSNYRYYTDNLPGYRYRWEAVNGTISNPNADDILVKWTTLNSATQLKAYYIDREAPNCESAPAVMDIRTLAAANIGLTRIAPLSPNDIRENCTATYVCNYGKADDYQWNILPSNAGSIIKNGMGDTVTIQWHEIGMNTNVQISLTLKKCINQTRTFTVNETLLDIPDMLVTASIAATCPGTQVDFTTNYPSSPATQWYVDGAHVSTGAAFTYDFSGDATIRGNVNHRITASGIFYCGVKREHSVMVTVQPGALMSIQPSANVEYCEGTPVPSRVITVNNGNPGVYTWYKNGAVIPNVTGSTYTAAEPGTYYATTLIGGCLVSSYTFSISQKSCGGGGTGTGTSGTTIPLTIAGIDYCEKMITAINPSPGNTALSWQSSGATRLDPSTADSVRFRITGAGTVTITAKIIVSNCTTLYEAPPQFIPYLPDIKTGYYCDGSNNFIYTFTDNSSVAQGYGDYTTNWTLDATPYSGNSVQHAFLPGANGTTHTITIHLPNGIQCTKPFLVKRDADAQYTVTPNPASSGYCEDTPLLFQPTTATPDAQTYFWTFGDNATSTLQSTEKSYVINNQSISAITYSPSLYTEDKMGCYELFSGAPIVINKNNFEGKVTFDPVSEVCPGTPVTLQYQMNAGTDSAMLSYLWSHNNSTSPTVTVTQPGDYYVTVGDSSMGCYKLSAPGTPAIIKTGPVVISGKTTLCQGESGTLTANTGNTGTTYKWFRNGNQQISTAANLNISSWSPGSYPVRVEVSTPIGGGNHCTETATATVEIKATPPQPKISFNLLTCEPYVLQLSVTNPQSNGTYQWSNGAAGQSVTVPQGGPYRVRYTTPEGCRSESDVLTIPCSPDYYFWTFPKGCYNLCDKIDYFVHGPSGFPFNQSWDWQWIAGGNRQSSGNWVSYDAEGLNPYLKVNAPASRYEMFLKSNLCSKTTPPFHVKWEKCDYCQIDIKVLRINCVRTDDGQEAYLIDFDLVNRYPFPLYYTLVPQQGSLVVQGGIMQPGSNAGSYLYIPSPGFINGIVIFTLQANNVITGDYCEKIIEFRLNRCPDYGYVEMPEPGKSGKAAQETEEQLLPNTRNGLVIYPNPAQTEITVAYSLPQNGAEQTLEIYDMQGRKQGYWNLPQAEGKLRFNVSQWKAGAYLVKLLSGGQTVEVKKMTIVP